jgi:hypothetical protein
MTAAPDRVSQSDSASTRLSAATRCRSVTIIFFALTRQREHASVQLVATQHSVVPPLTSRAISLVRSLGEDGSTSHLRMI